MAVEMSVSRTCVCVGVKAVENKHSTKTTTRCHVHSNSCSVGELLFFGGRHLRWLRRGGSLRGCSPSLALGCANGLYERRGFQEAVGDFADLKRVIAPAERSTVLCLAHVLEARDVDMAFSDVREHPDRPHLVIYASDGWGARACGTRMAHSGSQVVRRKAYRRHEFLLERGFVKTRSPQGGVISHSLVKAIRGLALGKTHWEIFSACTEFMSLAYESGARGIVVTVYLNDGHMFEALKRAWTGRHRLYWKTVGAESFGAMASLHSAMDWVLPIKCVAHGFSNAIKIGMSALTTESMLDDLFMSCSSLRAGSIPLLDVIDLFLVRRLQPSDLPTGSFQDRMAFWLALGFSGTVLDMFLEHSAVMISSVENHS